MESTNRIIGLIACKYLGETTLSMEEIVERERKAGISLPMEDEKVLLTWESMERKSYMEVIQCSHA